MRSEDGRIIHECLNGETEAFGLLVDKYKEGIYAFVYGKVRDFQNAQDVTQEVFLQAYRDLRNLRRWESFVFWLYRIASTRCKLWIRSQSRRVDQEYVEDQDPRAMDNLSMDSHRDSQLDKSLREALDSLPEMHRAVLMLHYFGGMTSKEIAMAIGTSPGAIRMRLSRARAQLREEMVDMMDTAFEGQRMPAGFTLRIVEAVRRIKINPMPRMAGVPWRLSLALGILVAVLSLNPNMSTTSNIAIPAGSPLLVEAKVLKAGEIPVDILDVSQVSFIASKQGDRDGGAPQKAVMLAPQEDEGGKWVEKTGMLESRYGLSSSVVDGIIYAIGGAGGLPGPVLKSVEAYNPADDIWEKKAAMPTPRYAFSTSVVDRIIYVIGGWSDENTPLSTVQAYDPDTNTWTQKEDMPTARAGLSTSVVDGIIYAIGGLRLPQEGTDVSTVEAYNPVTDTWVKKVDMPTARGWLSTSLVDGIIYAIGGSNLPTVEAYDPTKDIWIQKEDMPTARGGISTSAVDGIIYAFGGNIGGQAGFKIATVEAYDPARDTWMRKADMLTARVALSTSVVNEHIYAIGGWSEVPDSPTNAVEEFDPVIPPRGMTVKPTGKLPTKWGEVKSE